MKQVQVHLGELRYGEEFVTPHRKRAGRVVDTGFVLWDDGTGRKTRVRAVHVRYGVVEKIHLAEMAVLVDANRPHMRLSAAESETRWSRELQEPGTIATIGWLAAQKRPPGERRAS